MLFGEAHNAAILDFAADPRNENDPLPIQFLPQAELPVEPTGDTEESELSTEDNEKSPTSASEPNPRKTVPGRTNSLQHNLLSFSEPESDLKPPLYSNKLRPRNKTAPAKKSSAKKVSRDGVKKAKKAKKRPYQKIPMAPLPAKLLSLGRDQHGNVKRRKPGVTALHEIKHQQKDGVAEGAILQWMPFARLVRDVMLDIPAPDGKKWRIQIEALNALRFACEQMVQN